jgi:hypothetical protein
MNITQHNIAAVRSDEFLRKHVAMVCDTPAPTAAAHEEIFMLLEIAYIMGRSAGVRELADALTKGIGVKAAA